MVRGLKEVTLHQADGLTKSFEIYDKQKPKENVLFFVDGDHSYESVKKELHWPLFVIAKSFRRSQRYNWTKVFLLQIMLLGVCNKLGIKFLLASNHEGFYNLSFVIGYFFCHVSSYVYYALEMKTGELNTVAEWN